MVVLVGHGIHLLIEHVVGHVGGHLVGVVGCVGWQAMGLCHVVKRGWLVHVVGLLLWRCIVHVLRDVMQCVCDELDSFTRVSPFNHHLIKLGCHGIVSSVIAAALRGRIFF